MIARYNNISLLAGVPGIVMQIAGNVMSQKPEPSPLAMALLFGGTALLMVGLAFYAKAKGRSPAWCLMGLLSIIGLIVLACLKDLAPDDRQRMS